MAINNDILYNAALVGFMSGLLGGRDVRTLSAGAITSINSQAVTFATAVDALIAEDATITTGGGDASQLLPTTSDIASATLAKANLLTELCKAAVEGRNAPAAAAQPSTVPAAIVAAYTAFIASLTNAA